MRETVREVTGQCRSTDASKDGYSPPYAGPLFGRMFLGVINLEGKNLWSLHHTEADLILRDAGACLEEVPLL